MCFFVGMSIIYSDPFGKPDPDISTINVISNSVFSHNLGKLPVDMRYNTVCRLSYGD